MKLPGAIAVLMVSAAVRLTACTPDTGYILRTENGTVCIFDARTGAQLSKTDMPAASLPETDRRALEEGIFLGTFPELTRACEDYCS